MHASETGRMLCPVMTPSPHGMESPETMCDSTRVTTLRWAPALDRAGSEQGLHHLVGNVYPDCRAGAQVHHFTVDLDGHRLEVGEAVLANAGLWTEAAQGGLKCDAQEAPLGCVCHGDDLEPAVVGADGGDLGHLRDVREHDAVEALVGSILQLNLERSKV